MSFEIISNITCDEASSFTFLQKHRCIRSTPPKCSVCDKGMTLLKICGGKRFIWRCPCHKGNQLGQRCGSFWERSRLPLSKLLQLAYFWSYNIPNSTCEEILGLSNVSVVHWYKMFRYICSRYFGMNPVRLGGQDCVVELGLFEKPRKKYRKVNNGTEFEVLPEMWVLGGICPNSDEGFLVLLPDLNAETVLSLIQQYVLPGSIIQTDEWVSHYDIGSLDVEPPYIHQTMESVGKHVENHWIKARDKFKNMCGVQFESMNSYFCEFEWRERFGSTGMDTFNNLLNHISQIYPTP